MNSDISSGQIRKAFLKIKKEMNILYMKLEHLEEENIKLNNKIDEDLKNKDNNLTTPSTKSNNQQQLFIANTLSGKVHLPHCPYAKKIAIQNKEEFEDIKQALRQKYIKCSCISAI